MFPYLFAIYENKFTREICLSFLHYDILDLLDIFNRKEGKNMRVHMHDRAPTITEVLQKMWENDTETAIIRAIGPGGTVTLEISIVDIDIKEENLC